MVFLSGSGPERGPGTHLGRMNIAFLLQVAQQFRWTAGCGGLYPVDMPRHSRRTPHRLTAGQSLSGDLTMLARFLDYLPDAAFIADRSGRVCLVNAAAARFFRRPASALVGKRQHEIFPSAEGRRHTRIIQKVSRTGKMHFKALPERLPGTDTWIETRLQPIRDKQGRVTHVLGLARNITTRVRAENALKESEENFRALAENAGEGILISVPPGRVDFANPQMARMSGRPLRSLIGMKLTELGSPAEAGRILSYFSRRLRGEEVPSRYEIEARHRDGRTIPVELSVARTSWKGAPAVLAIVRDISLQRQITEERRLLAGHLIEIREGERLAISATLHDNLGQLLTLSRLEMDAVAPMPGPSADHRRKALAHLDEALTAVRNLAVSLRPPILDDLSLQDSLADLADQFTRSRQRVGFQCGGRPVPVSRRIKTCLYRVGQEALTNMVRHSRASRAEISLRFTADEVRMAVKDDGIGFVQTKPGSPEGIGLLGMRERLVLCNGTLTIRSVPGRGTIVQAVVPLAVGAKTKKDRT